MFFFFIMKGNPHGHSGHVRFLTSVEMSPDLGTSQLRGAGGAKSLLLSSPQSSNYTSKSRKAETERRGGGRENIDRTSKYIHLPDLQGHIVHLFISWMKISMKN